MFMDKHAACSCLVAFEAVVRQNIKTNLTVSLGLAENCIGSQSYRPSDILLSRKGLTVKVADTDAEGRLILADVMNWTQ
jgi:leucyl aminopeptidase